MNQKIKKMFQISSFKQRGGFGFTLVEIIVATVIFALLSAAIMALFNYMLKINRKSDALRQATQGTRSLIETIVKEVHNGQIDYGVLNGLVEAQIPTCPWAPGNPANTVGKPYTGGVIYTDNTHLGIINTDNERECIYLDGTDLKLNKLSISAPVKLNPQNIQVQKLMFYIRPTTDAYSCVPVSSCATPRIQPFVVMIATFTAKLPTGETFSLNYQTTIDTNKYDVPQKLP